MPVATLVPATAPPQSQDARILAIAAEHVRRHGIARTTVVSVAREAGMTHANVYRYFPSKAALADAVTADWLKPLEAELAQVADAPDPADDKLERMLMAIASTQRDKLETDPNLFDLYVTAHEENRVRVAQAQAEGADAGRARDRGGRGRRGLHRCDGPKRASPWCWTWCSASPIRRPCASTRTFPAACWTTACRRR